MSLDCTLWKRFVRLGYFEDLRHFNYISVISRLGRRRYTVSEIVLVRPFAAGPNIGPLAPRAKSLTDPPPLFPPCEDELYTQKRRYNSSACLL